ncbi:MAG TPA: hypothetical protein VLT82_17465 [Myxococcaceae bacterium]|nr:hypothetical protein [Myxococcaceae bacterium]
MQEETEEARERHFWGVVLKSTVTSLIILVVVGVLAWLTWALDWRKYLLLCFVGLAAGSSIAVAALSAHGRELVGLVLGAITLPLMAVHLAGVAATNEAAFGAYRDGLLPFFTHAAGPILAAPWISRIWRRRPERPEPALPADEAAVHEGASP